MTRVMQHGFVLQLDDGRQTRFVVFSKEETPDEVPCFKCGETCLVLHKADDNATWDVQKPLHPTADDQQHCADCCRGCKINRRKDVVL